LKCAFNSKTNSYLKKEHHNDALFYFYRISLGNKSFGKYSHHLWHIRVCSNDDCFEKVYPSFCGLKQNSKHDKKELIEKDLYVQNDI